MTDPLGNDFEFSTTQLTESTPSSNTTSVGWRRWTRLVTATMHGRWTYQFTSTGTILSADGGAFAVARPLASTST